MHEYLQAISPLGSSGEWQQISFKQNELYSNVKNENQNMIIIVKRFGQGRTNKSGV